jgi:hypothetical protein
MILEAAPYFLRQRKNLHARSSFTRYCKSYLKSQIKIEWLDDDRAPL